MKKVTKKHKHKMRKWMTSFSKPGKQVRGCARPSCECMKRCCFQFRKSQKG